MCQEGAASPETGDPSWAGEGEPRMPAGSYCDGYFEENFAEYFCTSSAAVCSCRICNQVVSDAVAGCTRVVQDLSVRRPRMASSRNRTSLA